MISGTRRVADRGISTEGMAALGFALTVLMIAVAGGLLMQTSDSLSDGGPILSTTSDSVHATGADSQWVRIEHASGDTVSVADLDIVVNLPDHSKRARLHAVPTERLTQDDYTGNHVFTRGSRGIEGAIAAGDGDAEWAASEVIAFRIEERRVDLEPGQTVEVTVRNTESETELSQETISVVE